MCGQLERQWWPGQARPQSAKVVASEFGSTYLKRQLRGRPRPLVVENRFSQNQSRPRLAFIPSTTQLTIDQHYQLTNTTPIIVDKFCFLAHTSAVKFQENMVNGISRVILSSLLICGSSLLVPHHLYAQTPWMGHGYFDCARFYTEGASPQNRDGSQRRCDGGVATG